MDLSKIFPDAPDPKQPGPKQPMGGIGDGKKNGASSDQDSTLWQDQQKHLATVRQELCELEKRKRAGEPCDEQIASKLKLLSCTMNVGAWEDLFPLFDAISKLDVKYHRVIVIFGGWHHTGELEGIKPPAANLQILMRRYRGLVRAEMACRELAKRGLSGAGDTSAKLKEVLETYKDVLPTNLWNHPDRLVEFVEKMKPVTATEIENALLFLEQRIFAFAPTKNNPLAGWQDFQLFVFAYRRLVGNFNSSFSQYYWGIFPTKN